MFTTINYKHKALVLVFFCLILKNIVHAQEVFDLTPKVDPAFISLIEQKTQIFTQSDIQQTMFHHKVYPSLRINPENGISETRYSCIVYTHEPEVLKRLGVVVDAVFQKFVTAWATLNQIEQLSLFSSVKSIVNPDYEKLHNDIAVSSSGANLLHAGVLNHTKYTGKGVIVAIYDSGIDWKHPDFCLPNDRTKSRILKIWDQTITAVSGENPPSGFTLGVEYTKAQIDDELAGITTGKIRERDTNGHGTHVAGTVTGNGAALNNIKYAGMAPEADIVVIKGGNGSFPTTNTSNAIAYLKNLANTLGRPIVLNMSIGGQSGPHDGTMSHELAVDDFTISGSGRVVVISAGNDNGSKLHKQLAFSANESKSISFNIGTATSSSEDYFEFGIWANSAGAMSASFSAPNSGGTVTVASGNSTSVRVLNNSFTVSLSSTLYATNGLRYIRARISRYGSNTTSPLGNWVLTLNNLTTNALVLDGWLSSNDAVFSNIDMAGDDNYLVGSPGCASSAITAASYVVKNSWYASNGSAYSSSTAFQDRISSFSAMGPRRDSFQKPDIAAIGQYVVSCMSSSVTESSSDIIVDNYYSRKQGTSMSSPVIAGAAALLLQYKPNATATEIKSAMKSSAIKDTHTTAVENNTWGAGKLNVFQAMNYLASCANYSTQTYAYDKSQNASLDNGVNTNFRKAVRVSPNKNGKLAGVYFTPSQSVANTIVEIRSSNAGLPGNLLSTVTLNKQNINPYTPNYVDFTDKNISIANTDDYFIVLYKDPLSSDTWSIRRENVELDNRSFTSSNNGVNWSTEAYDYKFRMLVYDNEKQISGIASTTATDTVNLNFSNLLASNDCKLIANISNSQAISNSVLTYATQWVEGNLITSNDYKLAKKHFEINNVDNSLLDATIKLYFSQADFDAYNAGVSGTKKLPSNSNDAAGIANLRLFFTEGKSTDYSGLPASYPNNLQLYNPADNLVIWNVGLNAWQITVSKQGFGGIYLGTEETTLPVKLISFIAKKEQNSALLTWQSSEEINNQYYEIHKSVDGVNFYNITKVNAKGNTNSSNNYFYIDKAPAKGINYYKLSQTDFDGETKELDVKHLVFDFDLALQIYPNPAQNSINLIGLPTGSFEINIINSLGVSVFNKKYAKYTAELNIEVGNLSAGTYLVTLKSDAGEKTIKFIKE